MQLRRIKSSYRARELHAQGSRSTSLLLLFGPQVDVVRGRVETEGGELVGVYAATTVLEGAREVVFDVGSSKAHPDPAGCKAVVVQMQRHNVEAHPAAGPEFRRRKCPRGILPGRPPTSIAGSFAGTKSTRRPISKDQSGACWHRRATGPPSEHLLRD